MTASLLLMMLFSQAPEQRGAVVLLTRRTGATAAVSSVIIRDLRKALADAGVGSPLTPEELARRLLALGVKDSTSCDGKKACVLELGRQLGVPIVVAVSLGQIAKDLSIHVEALRV